MPERGRLSRPLKRREGYLTAQKAKISSLRYILKKHRDDKITVFTRYNDLVYSISREFLIPALLTKHQMKRGERP